MGYEQKGQVYEIQNRENNLNTNATRQDAANEGYKMELPLIKL